MPEDASGTGDASRKQSSSSNHHQGSKNDDRPIDNIALAALLRECALFVEEGQFDPVLYTALQDFRVYYKQKYPKIKRTKSDEKPSNKKKIKKKIVSNNSNDPTHDSPTVIAANTVIGTSSTDTTNAFVEPNYCAQEDPSEAEAAAEAEESDTVKTQTSENTAEKKLDEHKIAEQAPKEPFSATGNVSVAAPTTLSSTTTGSPMESASTVEMPIPVSHRRPVPAAPAPAPYIPPTRHASLPNHTTASSTTPSSSTATTKFHLGQAVFGKLGIPKVANNLKQAAFNATSKKNSQRVLEDLGLFSNELSRQAESSARRRAPSDSNRHPPISSSGDYHEDVWCDVHFCKGCACKTTSARRSPTHSDTVHGPEEHAVGSGMPLSNKKSQGHERSDSVLTDELVDHAATSVNGVESTSASTGAFDTSRAVRNTSTAATQLQRDTGPGVYISKQSFQRSPNPKSPLLVNGWIEQQRRSKLRYVWKEVLASLVRGTKPGEETTLWIQREIINPITGRQELEALERIPLKVIEDVSLKEFTGDNQFTLKVFNSPDEFVFRCNGAPADSMMWVQTITHYVMIARGMIRAEENETKETLSPRNPQQQTYPQQPHQEKPPTRANVVTPEPPSSYSIAELRAICHGAGINTAGMERSELMQAAEAVRKRGTYFDRSGSSTTPPTTSHSAPAQTVTRPPPPSLQAQPPENPSSVNAPVSPLPPTTDSPHVPTTVETENAKEASPEPAPEASEKNPKLSIKELRAICHGAGINTVGMERKELEAAAEEVRSRGTYFDPPPGMHAPSEEEIKAQQEQFQKQETLRRQQEAEALRQAQLKEAAELEAKRAAAEEELKRRAAEEEHRRNLAAEQMLQQQEAQRRYQEQQAAWQRQQEEEEQRRRKAEQQAAEERRRREEAYLKTQKWAGQQAHSTQQRQQQQHHQSHPQQQWNQSQHSHQGYPHHQQHSQGWHQQQQREAHYNQKQGPSNAGPAPHPHHPSAASEKYAAMANQTGDDGQAVITRIKHDILIYWALQPPQLLMLRPIDVLVTTIHKVFPPALGVSGHDYFQKWKPITPDEISGSSGLADDEKLKKCVRKIRFFLHPDKLPYDLNEEQKFMTKMLWDVTSDAWEEFQKHKEDLDWVKT